VEDELNLVFHSFYGGYATVISVQNVVTTIEREVVLAKGCRYTHDYSGAKLRRATRQ